LAIGRTLWLFHRSDQTAEHAVRLTSLLMATLLHRANERAYLGLLLAEVARRDWSVEVATRLAPAAWLPLTEELNEGAAAEA